MLDHPTFHGVYNVHFVCSSWFLSLDWHGCIPKHVGNNTYYLPRTGSAQPQSVAFFDPGAETPYPHLAWPTVGTRFIRHLLPRNDITCPTAPTPFPTADEGDFPVPTCLAGLPFPPSAGCSSYLSTGGGITSYCSSLYQVQCLHTHLTPLPPGRVCHCTPLPGCPGPPTVGAPVDIDPPADGTPCPATPYPCLFDYAVPVVPCARNP